MSTQNEIFSVTIPWIRSQKGKSKLTMLTAYDFPTAKILDESGIEMILVGDSVGTVIYGQPDTVSVTTEDILRHTQAVTSAAKNALVIADMPYLSYQISIEDALRNAGRFIKEGRAKAVKIEGGLEYTETVKALTRASIPVMGHIGLMPQSIHQMGKYRMHGKNQNEQAYLMESAKQLEAAGAFAIVLECVEENLAKEISESLLIPTIGIGSGNDCDGQVLVFHDLVGLTAGKVPKFVRQKAQLGELVKKAVKEYIEEVKG